MLNAAGRRRRAEVGAGRMVLAEWRNAQGVLNAAGRRRKDEAGAGRMVFQEWRNEEGMNNAVERRRHEEGAGWMAFAEGRRDTNTQQTCGARLSSVRWRPSVPACVAAWMCMVLLLMMMMHAVFKPSGWVWQISVQLCYNVIINDAQICSY